MSHGAGGIHPADRSHSALDGAVLTLSHATAALRRLIPATVALALSLSMVAGTLVTGRVEAVPRGRRHRARQVRSAASRGADSAPPIG